MIILPPLFPPLLLAGIKGLTDADKTTAVTDTTTINRAAGSTGPQFIGDNTRDTGLVGSGLTSSGAKTDETGAEMAGTGYDDRNRDPTLGDSGGVTGAGTGRGLSVDTSTRDEGLMDNTSAGSGLGTDKRDAGIEDGATGSGLVADDERNRGDSSNTAAGSGLSGRHGEGLGYQTTTTTTTAGSGLGGTGAGYSLGDSSNTATGTGLGAGATDSSGGVDSREGRYVEGSEQHHRGDGHAEDTVHPGPHLTGTAKALDPHLN